MAPPVTFKVLRVVDGRCNFAESTVIVERGADGSDRAVASASLLESEFGWGVSDAIRGTSAALNEFGTREDHIIIDAMRITLVDSNPDNIAVSAYIATAGALGVDVALETFVEDGQVVFTPP